jgi:hypothetical protein
MDALAVFPDARCLVGGKKRFDLAQVEMPDSRFLVLRNRKHGIPAPAGAICRIQNRAFIFSVKRAAQAGRVRNHHATPCGGSSVTSRNQKNRNRRHPR